MQLNPEPPRSADLVLFKPLLSRLKDVTLHSRAPLLVSFPNWEVVLPTSVCSCASRWDVGTKWTLSRNCFGYYCSEHLNNTSTAVSKWQRRATPTLTIKNMTLVEVQRHTGLQFLNLCPKTFSAFPGALSHEFYLSNKNISAIFLTVRQQHANK